MHGWVHGSMNPCVGGGYVNGWMHNKDLRMGIWINYCVDDEDVQMNLWGWDE